VALHKKETKAMFRRERKGSTQRIWRDEVLFTGKKDKDKGKEYKWVLWVYIVLRICHNY
jgi:hypothetical protein